MNSQIPPGILLHFDTCYGMRLHYDTFTSSLKAVETAANFTAKNLFGKQCRVELTDICIEEGSLKQIIATAIITSAVNVGINESFQWIKSLFSQRSHPPIEQYLEQKKYKVLIDDTTTAILGTTSTDLRAIFFNNCTFVNCSPETVIKDKNKFYKNAQKDENFKGLGFKDEHEFPINKSNINDYIDCQLEEPATHAYQKLILISPVVDRNSQKQWSFKFPCEKQAFSYEMQDEAFQSNTSEGKFNFKEGTEIEAKICTKKTKDDIKRSVLEVYSIDGKEIKTKPKDFNLDEPINVIHQPDFHQPDLFSF